MLAPRCRARSAPRWALARFPGEGALPRAAFPSASELVELRFALQARGHHVFLDDLAVTVTHDRALLSLERPRVVGRRPIACGVDLRPPGSGGVEARGGGGGEAHDRGAAVDSATLESGELAALVGIHVLCRGASAPLLQLRVVPLVRVLGGACLPRPPSTGGLAAGRFWAGTRGQPGGQPGGKAASARCVPRAW
eukprot:scaffold87843_cov60-Phaeocystis_antarctica.AAC.4